MSGLPHEAFLAAIAGIDGIGPARMRSLLSLGTPQEIWRRLVEGSLGPAAGVDADLVRRWSLEASSTRVDEVWRRCESLGVGVVSLGSPGYPPALADDVEPPVVLFQKGDPEALNRGPRVAVVGTRRATGYGLRVAERLGSDLAAAGVVVVSGLALGIDAAAHRGAIARMSEGIGDRVPVVGVVANGLDAPCPARNRRLAGEVASVGILYSEVPPGSPSAPWRFPVRNRVIAALADAVVVVESAGRGGSMHTVREALDRGRAVLAVPGPIDSRSSEGTNQLIREGAAPCLGVEDVLMALPTSATEDRQVQTRLCFEATGRENGTSGARERRSADPRPEPQGNDALVLEALDWRPTSLDTLAANSGLGLRDLAASLSRLESTGWIVRSGSWVERRAR